MLFQAVIGCWGVVLKLVAGKSSRYLCIVWDRCCFFEEYECVAWWVSAPTLVHLLSILRQEVKDRSEPREVSSPLQHWKSETCSCPVLSPSHYALWVPLSLLLTSAQRAFGWQRSVSPLLLAPSIHQTAFQCCYCLAALEQKRHKSSWTVFSW